MARITILISAVTLLLAVCFCAKNPESVETRSAFALDTLAVRAILDANKLNTISENLVRQQSSLSGEPRISDLFLDSATLFKITKRTDVFIDTIPPQIGQLTALVNVQLYKNRIRSLPEEIRNLVNTSALNINENRLTSLPAAIGSMTSLRSLNAKKNNLTAIPLSIGSCKKLNSIDVSFNQLTTLPDTIAALDSLQNIVYNNNLIVAPLSSRVVAKLNSIGIDTAVASAP